MNAVSTIEHLKSVREPAWLPRTLIVACAVPAAYGCLALLADLVTGTRLFGADPIKHAEHFFGDWTLRMLVATLAVTPLRALTGWVWLTRRRRALGLAAFGYLMAHWLVYALLDVQLDLDELLTDLAKRPYITLGMAALLAMLPLAITSTVGMRQRLGRRWASLHRLVYAIAILGTLHFALSVKKDLSEPLLYAGLFAGLLAWRAYAALRAAVRRAAPPGVGHNAPG